MDSDFKFALKCFAIGTICISVIVLNIRFDKAESNKCISELTKQYGVLHQYLIEEICE